MGTRRVAIGVALAALGLLSVGCVQPAPGDTGPAPVCPARQRFVVETTDQANAAVVRAISDNGQWLVTSRTVGGAVQLRLRAVDPGDPGIIVGSIPDTPLEGHPVAVSNDGNRVVWQVVSVVGDQVVTEFLRWDRSTGTVQPIPAPDAGHPIPSRLSPDGKVATWLTGLPNTMPAYTEALTDAVWTPPALDLTEYGKLETALGFSPRPDGSESADVVASPDGRWWAVTYDRQLGAHTRLARWDVEADELTPLRGGRFLLTGMRVANDGSILTNEPPVFPSFERHIRVTAFDGSVRTLHANQPLGFPAGDGVAQSGVLAATPDLRAVAFTEISALPPTAQVVVSRCQ